MTFCTPLQNRPFMQVLPLLLAAGLAVPAVAAPVFVESSSSATVSARASFFVPEVTGSDAVTFAAPSGSTHLSAAALSVDKTVNAQVQTLVNMRHEWVGAEQGSVQIETSFSSLNHDISWAAVDQAKFWDYTFWVDRDSVFRMQYDVALDPLLGGLSDLGYRGIMNGETRSMLADSQGELVFDLLGGQTYTFQLRGLLPLWEQSNTAPKAGYNGFFQWWIEDAAVPPPPSGTVPEPASGVLVLGALAALALTRQGRTGRR